MAELKLSGNHLKGSRPVLSFDKAFDGQPHLQLVKEMLGQIFTTPRRHHKSKPFFDHVLSFSVADDRIWMRNYQVCDVRSVDGYPGGWGRAWAEGKGEDDRIWMRNYQVRCVAPGCFGWRGRQRACIGTAWVLHAYCMGTACVLYAYCMGTAWVLHGYCMGTSCVLHGYCMRTAWGNVPVGGGDGSGRRRVHQLPCARQVHQRRGMWQQVAAASGGA
eukprot:351290-Chlamydomonas_euryale.AAC.1